MMTGKTNPGNFFEDFQLGQEIIHATPRTVTEGDAALYTALYGSCFAAPSSDMFAMSLGYEGAPMDDLLVFHMVFGKTVADISLNAVANLGYAAGRFGAAVYAGDTLRAVSRVIGLKENSNGKTGVVYVQSTGLNQREEPVLDYVRWVMVNKADPSSAAPETVIPDLDPFVGEANLIVPESLDLSNYDTALSGSGLMWGDYDIGDKIDHVNGMTIEEADHMMATRLYQNTAKVHFNQHVESAGRFGRRIVYGGHVISLARSLSYNGLANAFHIVAINGGTHIAPTFAGDTIYAWTEVVGKMTIPGRDDLGALRLRMVATKDQDCAAFPDRDASGKPDPAMVLELDFTVLIPR